MHVTIDEIHFTSNDSFPISIQAAKHPLQKSERLGVTKNGFLVRSLGRFEESL